MIADSVAFLVARGKRVLLDAEHFASTATRLDPGYALDCLRAAAAPGAGGSVLCDTNGGSLPARGPGRAGRAHGPARRGARVHTHDDSGCAVANTLVAVQAGAPRCRGRSTASGSAPATPT